MDENSRELRKYFVHEELLDGRKILIRAIHSDDKSLIQNGMRRLSADTFYFRFSQCQRDFSDEELMLLTNVDFQDHVALVAILTKDNTDLIVGVGRYIIYSTSPATVAEIAITVDDAYRRVGIATLLLRHVIDIARAEGIQELVACIHQENRKMIELLSHSGLPMSQKRDGGAIEIRLIL